MVTSSDSVKSARFPTMVKPFHTYIISCRHVVILSADIWSPEQSVVVCILCSAHSKMGVGFIALTFR